MRPKRGDRPSVKWARDLQHMSETQGPPGSSRTSVGIVQSDSPRNSMQHVLAKNTHGATLDPWTLIGLEPLDPPATEDGRLYMQTTLDRSKLLVTSGPATVPSNGWFIPTFFGYEPLRVKADSSATMYWNTGCPCGRKPNDVLLSTREGGLICLKTPDAQNYAWVIVDYNTIWKGVVIGDITPNTDPFAGTINGLVGVHRFGALTEQRLDIVAITDIAIADGSACLVGYTDCWDFLWINCLPTEALEGEEEAPDPPEFPPPEDPF